MKFMEIYFWNALWWAGYLAISLSIFAITGYGSIPGILLIGLLFTLVISAFLIFLKGILLDDWEPIVIVYDEPEQPEVKPVIESKQMEVVEEKVPEITEDVVITELPKEKMLRIRQEFDLTKIETQDGGEEQNEK